MTSTAKSVSVVKSLAIARGLRVVHTVETPHYFEHNSSFPGYTFSVTYYRHLELLRASHFFCPVPF